MARSGRPDLTFTLPRVPSPPIYLNNVGIAPATTVKYLGLHFDNKLNWKAHIIKKRKQMDLRHKELYLLLGRSSPLSVGNNSCCTNLSLLLYGPMALNYGSVLPTLQSYRDTSLKYYEQLLMPHGQDPRRPRYSNCARSVKHRIKLQTHSNPLLHRTSRDNVIRRPKRRWPADLQYGERYLLARGDVITLAPLQV